MSVLNPLEIFSKEKVVHVYFIQTNVLGFLYFSLYLNIESVFKVPKCTFCSSRVQFLGFSPDHYTSVASIHNLETKCISTHFRVFFGECLKMCSIQILLVIQVKVTLKK